MLKLGGGLYLGSVLSLVLALGGTAVAGVFDKPAFTATPSELLAEARAAATADAEVVVLREDFIISIDDAGRFDSHARTVFVVVKAGGADEWGTFGASWSPFYEDRPVIRARVISAAGVVAELDQTLISDAPSVSESPSVYSDRRDLRVPLPRLAVGAVVEEERSLHDREPLLAAGSVSWAILGQSVPTTRSVVTITAPAAHKPHIVTVGFAKAPAVKQTTAQGRTTWVYDAGAIAPLEPRPDGLPTATAAWPAIGVATGASWAAVAEDYRKIVDKRIAEGPVTAPPGVAGASDRETVDRTLAWLHAHVRYTGIELSDAAIIPWPPARAIARGFGDCKDKATLLVALLRASGIRADLALLLDGVGPDVRRELPGLGSFDHAIVRALVGGKPVWIDATEQNLPAGQLPVRDQGRNALVIASGTRDLESTPVGAPADNTSREVRTFHIAEHGHASVTEVATATGVFWADQSDWVRSTTQADQRKNLEAYATGQYVGTLRSFAAPVPDDVTKQFAMTVEIDDTARVNTAAEQVDAYLWHAPMLDRLPAAVGTESEKLDHDVKARTADYVWHVPQVMEVENRLVLPTGFAAPTLVADETQALGTMTLSTHRALDHDTLVITFHLDTGKRRISAAELATTRAAVLALRKQSPEHVVIPLLASKLVSEGKMVEAIAEIQRLVALHPKEALHYAQLARAYREAGMGIAARRAARKGVEVEPKNAEAYRALGDELHRDSFGLDHGFDADRAGALAAYRKGLTFDPKDAVLVGTLADVLVKDAHGNVSWDAAERDEASASFQRVEDLVSTHALDEQIATLALFSHHWAKAETAARTAADGPRQQELVLAAIAGARGAQAALDAASSLVPSGDRKKVLAAVGVLLEGLRLYDAARTIYAAVPDALSAAEAAELARITPVNLAKSDVADPRTPCLLSFLSLVNNAQPKDPPWSAAMWAVAMQDVRKQRLTKPLARSKALPPEVIGDLLSASASYQVEGSARDGWHVVIDIRGSKSGYFVVLVHGRATLIGAGDDLGEVGARMLDELAHGDLASATRWFDWIVADHDMTQGVGAQLARLRDTELARTATTKLSADAVELGAALLAARSSSSAKAALPALQKCAASDEMKPLCRLYGIAALERLDRFAEAAEAVKGDLDLPVAVRAIARSKDLERAGKHDDALADLDAALASSPGEHRLLSERAELTVRTSWAAAEPFYARLAASPAADASDFNSIAWARLYFDPVIEHAREAATRGEHMTTELAADFANTLAAIEAESDHPVAAWKYSAKAVTDHADQPDGGDWYVYGRIAESYGLRDDAVAAYKRVMPAQPGGAPPTAFMFAKRRLDHLGVH